LLVRTANNGVTHVTVIADLVACERMARGSSCLRSYQGLAPLLCGWSKLSEELPIFPPIDRTCTLKRSPLTVAIYKDNQEGVAWHQEAELLAC
jgi:hypothetical protein